MANNIIKRIWNQNRMVNIDYLGGFAFCAEDGGHTFQISGIDDEGNTVALSGTVAGVFLRPDNTDVAITGSASGGVVSVTLPANCYDVPGRFGLTVFVTANGQKTAVYAAVGTVSRTSSGAVSPGTTADVVDLINQINAAVATIPASWPGLMADIAPTYSASAVYPVGAYVYYNGDLYRCTTAITTAESWTAGHWTQAVLGNDVADLNSALSYDKTMMIATDKSELTTTWSQGRLDGGSSYHIRSGYIDINQGDIICVKDIKYVFKVGFYSSSGTMTSISDLTNLYIADNSYRIRIQMQNTNEQYSILPAEGDNCVFTRNVIDAVSKIPTFETKSAELYTLSDLLAFSGAYSFPASFYARGRYSGGYPVYDITYRANMPDVVRLGYDAVITPVDSSFRVQVLLYNESDVFVSVEEITSAKSVPKNQGFRLFILRREESTSEIADLYEFARAVEVSSFMTSSATGEKYVLQTVPFAEYKIDAKLYKMNNSYVSLIKPRNNFIRVANGVTVYMAVNGNDENDGLSSANPKKTFASAVAVQNVQTIILAEGTYEAGAHFANGEQITVPINLIGVGNVVIKNGHYSTPITFINSLYCENITFYWGNNAIIVQYDSYDKIATFYKCKFEKSGVNNGLYALGGLTYVIECEATGNASDGFNYHANGTILNHAIEINCKSSFNGNGNNFSSNATTTHNGNYIVRVNGDYKCCYGGVLADQEAYSANYGCSVGISTVTDEAEHADKMANYWCSSAVMYLFDCISYGSLYDTATIGTGEIISNVEYESNYTG